MHTLSLTHLALRQIPYRVTVSPPLLPQPLYTVSLGCSAGFKHSDVSLKLLFASVPCLFTDELYYLDVFTSNAKDSYDCSLREEEMHNYAGPMFKLGVRR